MQTAPPPFYSQPEHFQGVTAHSTSPHANELSISNTTKQRPRTNQVEIPHHQRSETKQVKQILRDKITSPHTNQLANLNVNGHTANECLFPRSPTIEFSFRCHAAPTNDYALISGHTNRTHASKPAHKQTNFAFLTAAKKITACHPHFNIG